MKKTLRRVMIIIVSVSIFFSLCSCRLEESYKEFNIKNITDNLNEDYFTSEDFVFATVQDVVIIPEIKEINHGEYILYISSYSKEGEESVQIKNVVFKEKETILFSRGIDKEIKFSQNTESIYKGWIDGGRFTEDALEIADGREYNLVVLVEVIKNGVCVSKSITFEIIIKGYKSLVWPT